MNLVMKTLDDLFVIFLSTLASDLKKFLVHLAEFEPSNSTFLVS